MKEIEFLLSTCLFNIYVINKILKMILITTVNTSKTKSGKISFH